MATRWRPCQFLNSKFKVNKKRQIQITTKKINFQNFPNTKPFGKFFFPNTKPFGKFSERFSVRKILKIDFSEWFSVQIRKVRVPENMVRIRHVSLYEIGFVIAYSADIFEEGPRLGVF